MPRKGGKDKSNGNNEDGEEESLSHVYHPTLENNRNEFNINNNIKH